ncbi:MAG: acetyl-CoA carboxylase biotin carboxylase subunit, partial [Myxococcota bacterium]
MITNLLIANRGEIAVRIARTARRLGIRTVAVFTEPDRHSLHPQSCDQAICIPDYLDGDAIIAAAKRAGASAVHPGFGFLAENASFAAAVVDAGLVWVGPSAHAIEVMGSKAAARAMMADAGVPVLPGYDGDDQTDATLLAAAEEIGWPVIVKASAGGGGKGMQVVESTAAFLPALAEARRLALSAFGDDRMIVERYLPIARHIEVQVMADSHGSCVHLWERECSIQRRHQKVIEEAPSPVFVGKDAQEQRETLCNHAVRAAEAVNYEGAGTVEFVMDANGQAYFLEMNTRLQVEHPVTECITGFDLVELQLRVAAGEPLGVDQQEIHGSGWAVEARLYAEDPDNNYLPSIGRLHVWDLEPSEGVRIDAGVESGSDVSIHYDPMLAKVIASGPTRQVAIQRLDSALSRLVALGVTTNRDHLIRILRHPDFVGGNLHTRFLDD